MTIYKAEQIKQYTVYESPDGGLTVYKRQSGSVDRELHSVAPELEEAILLERQRNLWMDIFNTGEHSTALQEAIERVIMLYELSKTEEPVAWHPV